MKTLVALFSRVWQIVRGLIGKKRPVAASSEKTEDNSKRREGSVKERTVDRKSQEHAYLEATGRKAQEPSLAQQVKTEEMVLREYYNKAVDPEVTFNVFYLRVVSFGWNKSEALYTQDKSRDGQCTVVFGGKEYALKDIYDSCFDAKVNYNTFYARVFVRGWDVRRALYTASR